MLAGMVRPKELSNVEKPPRGAGASQEPAVLDSLSDNELASLARAGNTGAFRILVDRHSNKAFWTAYNIVHGHEDARCFITPVVGLGCSVLHLGHGFPLKPSEAVAASVATVDNHR